MPPVCQVCRHPRAADIARALVAGDSSRSIAKRFETSASAIFRHRRHALKGAAIVRAVEARADREAETLVEEIRRLKADAARLAAKAEAEHDYRGALGAVKLLTDVALRLEEMMPTNATEAPILVSFSFPPSGLGGETRTTNDRNEYMPENVVVSPAIVEPSARQPEERDAVQSRPKASEVIAVPASEKARAPGPFAFLPPLGPGGRTRE